MAARRSGSAADGIILYSASEWKNKVSLYDRDCAYGYLDDPLRSATQNLARYTTTLPDGAAGGRVDAEVSCFPPAGDASGR